ncbi:MAG: NAD(P)-binding protein [Nitrospirae bacterium]|nr:NAD(P)-binding protein [Nitrospirota bacterium]
MSRNITRRDFLNGALIGAGVVLLDLPSPVRLFAQAKQSGEFGGIGDYALSHGNTAEVIRIFQAIEGGAYRKTKDEIIDRDERFELVIAGGGLSGLGAAYEFFKNAPKKAKCLILENHPIFGGTAKRNEFIVNGEHLIGPQGSNAFGVIDRPEIPGYEIYSELGIPTEFEYGELPSGLKPLDFDPTNFGYRLWFSSKNIGYYFDSPEKGSSGKWVAGFWDNELEGTPYPKKVREDFIKWQKTTERHYDGKDYERWLDSMTYQQYLENILKLDPEITRFAHPVLASVVGLGCDAISAFAARQVHMPGFPEFQGLRSLKNSHWHSFPGGNDVFCRYLVKTMIPASIEGSNKFDDIHNRKIRFQSLDSNENKVRIRLGASVVRVEHEGGTTSGNVSVIYLKDGRLYRLKAQGLVMASGSRLSRKVVADLPSSYKDAYDGFHVSPILVVNVALNNWRFLYRLGFTACKWFDGFGFGCNIRKPMYAGNYKPPLHPDKPAILTFYVSFHQPGLAIEEQGESGRRKLLGTSYSEFESQVVGQMKRLFADAGFKAEDNIAGIILNRWTYAYVNPQPGFYFGKDGKPAPRDVIRKPHGRVAFAHSELNGHQHWLAAIDEGKRAARQVV